MRGDVRFVVGMSVCFEFAVDEVAVEGHLEHPSLAGDQQDLKSLTELFEDCTRHAHGTVGVVSSPAEEDFYVLHQASVAGDETDQNPDRPSTSSPSSDVDDRDPSTACA